MSNYGILELDVQDVYGIGNAYRILSKQNRSAKHPESLHIFHKFSGCVHDTGTIILTTILCVRNEVVSYIDNVFI